MEKHKSGTGRYARVVIEVSTSLTAGELTLKTTFQEVLDPSCSPIPGSKSLIGGASKTAAKV